MVGFRLQGANLWGPPLMNDFVGNTRGAGGRDGSYQLGVTGHLSLHKHRKSSFLTQGEIFLGVAVKGGLSAQALGLTEAFPGLAWEPSVGRLWAVSRCNWFSGQA